MHRDFCRLSRAPGLVAAGILVFTVSLNNAWAVDGPPDRVGTWAQHRQEWVRAGFERDANRLEIKASQQAAWQDYAQACTALSDRMVVNTARDADAATIVKIRAERAADKARRLAALADATVRLQAVLLPEQRRTLDQIVHERRHGQGHRGWHRRLDGVHGDGHAHAWDPNEEAPAA